MKKNANLVLILAICLIIVIARLLPHLPNFSPLAAVILFTGVYAKSNRYYLLPLIALFISDLFLGFYESWVMVSVYASLAVNLLLAQIIKKNKNVLNLLNASLLSALIFFLATNFAVWAVSDWYQPNLSGLMLSYTMGIPFFKNTLASNILYTGLLFGVYESAAYWYKAKRLTFAKK